jgi:hypothetical protein
VAVGGIREAQAEDLGVLFGLLDAVGGAFVGRLGLNDGQRVVAAVA